MGVPVSPASTAHSFSFLTFAAAPSLHMGGCNAMEEADESDGEAEEQGREASEVGREEELKHDDEEASTSDGAVDSAAQAGVADGSAAADDEEGNAEQFCPRASQSASAGGLAIE